MIRTLKSSFVSMVFLGILLLFLTTVNAENDKTNWPKTVEEAVEVLKSDWLSDEDVEWMRLNPKQEVIAHLHMPFGVSVRNSFGLWGGNKELLKACGKDHPDDCSGVIFDALWESLRKESDPKLVKSLDCQFSMLGKININVNNYSKMQLGEVLNSLQEQIDEQLPALEEKCEGGLEFKLVGDPNLECWTRFEFNDGLTLNNVLQVLSWRNGFKVSNYPPRVILDFYEQCSWPEWPKHFQPDEN